MSRIAPCLWFDRQALEAARFYVSIFQKSKIGRISHYGEGAPMPKGTVLTVQFWLEGQEFLALNGGPQFKFSEAISLMRLCRTQREIDLYWKKLTRGGEESVCGWLKDKFGLSWQIAPAQISRWIGGKDPVRSNRVFRAVMEMKKPDIAKLKAAYEG